MGPLQRSYQASVHTQQMMAGIAGCCSECCAVDRLTCWTHCTGIPAATRDGFSSASSAGISIRQCQQSSICAKQPRWCSPPPSSHFESCPSCFDLSRVFFITSITSWIGHGQQTVLWYICAIQHRRTQHSLCHQQTFSLCFDKSLAMGAVVTLEVSTLALPLAKLYLEKLPHLRCLHNGLDAFSAAWLGQCQDPHCHIDAMTPTWPQMPGESLAATATAVHGRARWRLYAHV